MNILSILLLVATALYASAVPVEQTNHVNEQFAMLSKTLLMKVDNSYKLAKATNIDSLSGELPFNSPFKLDFDGFFTGISTGKITPKTLKTGEDFFMAAVFALNSSAMEAFSLFIQTSAMLNYKKF